MTEQTIYLIMVESVDQCGGINSACEAYTTKEAADKALAEANARQEEREKRRLAAGKSCGTVFTYWVEEIALLSSTTQAAERE